MKKTSIAIGLVVVGVAAGGVSWWRGKTAATAADAAASAPKPVQSVTLFTVRQQDVPVNIEAAGTVVPLNTVEIRPQVSTTTIKRIAIKEGQRVRQGDLLFTFDDRADAANLEKARATLLRDRATLADLERQLARAKDLRGQNFIAQSALDTVQSQLDAQRALVASDEAAVRSAEVALSYNTVRAPLAGRTGAITVNPGSLVQPSGAALVTISQVDPIGVSFTIPEAQLAALLQGGATNQGAQGAKATVLVPGADRNQRTAVDGVVSFIDNAVDSTSGTIRLKAELPNAKQLMWPGQYVTVKLTLRTLKDAAVVPQAAVIQRGQERQIYVVGADNVAELRPIQLRFAAGEMVAVDGVKPGERVVVEGRQNIRPGATVKDAPPAKAGAAASGPGGSASGAASGAASASASAASAPASGASQ